MRPGLLVRGGERDVRAEQRLDAHGRCDTGGPGEAIRVGQEKRPDRAHHLGAVEQGEAFLGLEGQRLQPGLAQRDHRRHHGPVVFHLAAADEWQRKVRERREIARRPDAPLLRDDRVDPQAKEVEQPVDEQRPAAAVAERERVGPQQQHRPDDLARERRPDAGRVAHQEVLLEAPSVGRLDEGRG